LLLQVQQTKTTWRELLEASRRLGRDLPKLRQWASSRGFFPNAAQQIQEYGWLLTLGDYLDPTVPRGISDFTTFLNRAKSDHSLLIMDVKGLGVINRMAQDRWIANGAPIDQLSSIAADGNQQLALVRDLVAKEFWRHKLPAPQNLLVEGDTVAYSLGQIPARFLNELINKMRGTELVYVGSGLIENSNPLSTYERVSLNLKGNCDDLSFGFR
jgi:hypothetical protein